MAKAVVDHLEAIEIEEQNREPAGVAFPEVRQASADRLQKHRAIGEPGERIAPQGSAASLHRGRLFRDVFERAGDDLGALIRTARSDATAQKPPVRSVLMSHPMFVQK